MTLPFESLMSSLDPPSTDIIKKFKNIVQERYVISKNINTSYEDVGKMSVLERKYILEFLNEEIKQKEETFKKLKEENMKKKNLNRR